MPRSRWKTFRNRFDHQYWQIVRRVNIKAYLRHEIDNDPNGDGDGPILAQDLMCIETKEYMKRADRVHVTTAEIPLPENSESHWQTAYDGDRFLPYHTLAKFKRAVEAAEYERSKRRRERNELWVKYFTALAATVAALASVYTAFFKK